MYDGRPPARPHKRFPSTPRAHSLSRTSSSIAPFFPSSASAASLLSFPNPLPHSAYLSSFRFSLTFFHCRLGSEFRGHCGYTREITLCLSVGPTGENRARLAGENCECAYAKGERTCASRVDDDFTLLRKLALPAPRYSSFRSQSSIAISSSVLPLFAFSTPLSWPLPSFALHYSLPCYLTRARRLPSLTFYLPGVEH